MAESTLYPHRGTPAWARGLLVVESVLVASLLAACATSPRAPPVHTTAPPRAAPNGLDIGSAVRSDDPYDWRNLAVAPFGSTLKDLKSSSHEVVLFDDVPDEDCRALEGVGLNFLAGKPDSYLVCFHHDRLIRFEVAAQVAAADADALLSKVCVAGLKGMKVEPTEERICQGRDGTVVFNASLGDEAADQPAGANQPADASQPASEARSTLTVTVFDDFKSAT